MTHSAFPPAETQPSKLEQARARLQDLFAEADLVRNQAHEALAALDQGDLDQAGMHLAEAEKTAGILPARRKWAELALEGAKAEVAGG